MGQRFCSAQSRGQGFLCSRAPQACESGQPCFQVLLVPDSHNWNGIGWDYAYHRTVIEVSKTRRPSMEFVAAFAAFYQPIDDEQSRPRTLPVADDNALIEYVKNGVDQDPDKWGLLHGVRLKPANWATLASVFAAAGVPRRDCFFGPAYKNFWGRWKSDETRTWIISSTRRERCDGTFEQSTMQLLIGGTVVDGNGEPQSNSGTVSPQRVRQIVLQNRNT
jgi:hypothetical protein